MYSFLFMQHWGVYSLLAQPEAQVRSHHMIWLHQFVLYDYHAYNYFLISQSTRNSAVYAEIGPIPQGKKAVVMPDITVQYAVVKKKQSTEQHQQCATGKAVYTSVQATYTRLWSLTAA